MYQNVSKKTKQMIKSEPYLPTYTQANVPLRYILQYVYREHYFIIVFLNKTRLMLVFIMPIRTKRR